MPLIVEEKDKYEERERVVNRLSEIIEVSLNKNFKIEGKPNIYMLTSCGLYRTTEKTGEWTRDEEELLNLIIGDSKVKVEEYEE